MMQRTISRVTHHEARPGFLGEGHTAVAVIDGTDFAQTDPFIVLMDDRVNLPGGEPAGGPHPHAGFETVTLVLKGDDKHWKTGTLELMTAGKGIIHTEEMTDPTDMRILQLWLALPKDKRWVEPRWQELLHEHVPVYTTDNGTASVYSGSSNGVTSLIQNYTPFTLVDFKMHNNAIMTQSIPASYNGFIYVVEGEVWVGDRKLLPDDAGWLSKADGDGETEVTFTTQSCNARFILYAAQPHGVPIVSHGPFIGDTREDILRLFHEYNKGKIPHLNDLDVSRKVSYT